MSVADHYENLLADHYSWMGGAFADGAAAQRALLSSLGVAPSATGRALDLGCGAGLQSVALAELGFAVTAIDTSRKLLAELATRAGGLAIAPVEGDIAGVVELVEPGFEVAVCMGDTLTHVPSAAAVERLFDGVARVLAPAGLFVLTFRDMTAELTGTDRFIPVRGDADRIMTCFLEYEPETVIVHDLIHLRRGAEWVLHKSSYRKLRLAPDWVAEALARRGFQVISSGLCGRLVKVVARWPAAHDA
jgi:SAM-dependent methyltransferase